MRPTAVPDAPLGLVAKQCHADADVEAAAAIAEPTRTATKNRRMTHLRYQLQNANFFNEITRPNQGVRGVHTGQSLQVNGRAGSERI
jgi:hypothetical protein